MKSHVAAAEQAVDEPTQNLCGFIEPPNWKPPSARRSKHAAVIRSPPCGR